MLSREDLSVLIVGYQRPESIEQILQHCSEADIQRIYVSIDAPKNSSKQMLERNLEIGRICSVYSEQFEVLNVRHLKSNVGCSANLLSACDWVFKHEEYVAIIEDDCIPSSAFFEFLLESLPVMNHDGELLLVCGTQFVPIDVSGSVPFKSKYSLTWGWATSARKWNFIRSEIQSILQNKIPLKLLSTDIEGVYWSEGARRAIQGFVDVWDTVLVNLLISKSFFALLPNENLVTNVGNDEVATHTGSDRNWLHEPIGKYQSRSAVLYPNNSEADQWLKSHFYRISTRHLFSTRATRMVDVFRRPNSGTLVERWNQANTN